VTKRIKSWQPALGSGYYLSLGNLELAN
jgi:hypothetical protein